MPTPKTISELLAMRVALLQTQIQEGESRKKALIAEIAAIDTNAPILKAKIQKIFDENGFKGMPIGGVLVDAQDNFPAGTVLNGNNQPYFEPEPKAETVDATTAPTEVLPKN
jgi:hypothetical protein